MKRNWIHSQKQTIEAQAIIILCQTLFLYFPLSLSLSFVRASLPFFIRGSFRFQGHPFLPPSYKSIDNYTLLIAAHTTCMYAHYMSFDFDRNAHA